MKFAESPTCHSGEPRYIDAPIVWEMRNHAGKPPDIRYCSYCGSVHPQDLVTLATVPIELEIADWKYGWPHKVYVTSGHSTLKFYSKHFADCADDEARNAVNDVLAKVGLRLDATSDGRIAWLCRDKT